MQVQPPVDDSALVFGGQVPVGAGEVLDHRVDAAFQRVRRCFEHRWWDFALQNPELDRVNYRAVPGKPDIALTRARIAVFVDGCFWHRCPIHFRIPRNNCEWWLAKLDRNVTRDEDKDASLSALGWTSLHYWEHDDLDEAADEIEWLWREL